MYEWILEFEKKLAIARGDAIQPLDHEVDPTARSALAKHWRAAGLDPATIRAVIPDIVDASFFYLLRAFSEGKIRMQFISDTGSIHPLEDNGGELLGAAHGMLQHSKERATDLFGDRGE
jgi:hypothetical protein